MTFDKRTAGFLLFEGAGVVALMLLVLYLPIWGTPVPQDPLSTDMLITYGLLVLAPLLIFLPLSLALKLGPLWLLGTGSWAMLGYVVFFVDVSSRQEASFFTYVAFLALVLAALASALAIPLGALSRRFLPPANPTSQMARAFRQGGLLALCAVTLLAMSPLGVLNWLNTHLVLTIIALSEFFFLARD